MNATSLRKQITDHHFNLPNFIVNEDVIRIESGDEL